MNSAMSSALLLVYTLLYWLLKPTSTNEDVSRGFLNFLSNPCLCRCGIPNREGRIAGGESLLTHEFPWLAFVHANGISRGMGALINSKYVITSTSQLLGMTPYNVKVGLGQQNRCFPDTSSLNISVERIIFHPDFNPTNRAHDLALLKLSQPVVFERRISPVCLGFPGSYATNCTYGLDFVLVGNSYLGQVSTVVGWSTAPVVDTEDVSSCSPKKLGLPVLDREKCLGQNSDIFAADKGCLGVVGSQSVICKGDSGGPVFYRSYGGIYELIGVLSDVNECNSLPGVSIFTMIGKHLSWIVQNTKDACYCTKTK